MLNKATNNGKLVIPHDKKQLRELIRFFDEDYVTASLNSGDTILVRPGKVV